MQNSHIIRARALLLLCLSLSVGFIHFMQAQATWPTNLPAIQYVIENCRGGAYLNLTPAQRGRLLRVTEDEWRR
jgi:hypothetical protein